jgi:deoxyribonuclease V
MLVALDAHYDDATDTGTGAAVAFEHWTDSTPLSEHTAKCPSIQPYIPGEFYKRELPCLLAVLNEIDQPPSTIIVDGFVWLGEKPGLGMRLWEALNRTTPIIGVAKTQFHGAKAIEILRGGSRSPLFVTAAGVESSNAAANIASMAGRFRIPALLKRVDQLARRK